MALETAFIVIGSGIASLAGAVVLMLFAGMWLDGKFGTSPWLMVAGIFFGLGAGMFQFIRTVAAVDRQEADEAEDRKKKKA